MVGERSDVALLDAELVHRLITFSPITPPGWDISIAGATRP